MGLEQVSGGNNESLSFEEFANRENFLGIPRYDNFWLFFLEAKFREEQFSYRKEGFFKRFQEENPELERRLSQEIVDSDSKRSGGRSDMLRKFDRKLYEAYLIMKSYGVPDEDLFS